jgi:Protein of unknown function (DUF2793)
MSDSLNLNLPYVEAAQAQKHVTVNEALSRLDALVHLAVVSRDIAAPPVAPTLGDRYLIPILPTGSWATHGGQIAMWLEGAWVYVVPKEGWRLWVSDEDVLLTYTGTGWAAGGVPTSLQNMQLIGVNAAADATNKFVVSSDATLFNHAGSGHQIKLSKNAAGDTASILWQTGFSGRAELGTTGDDNFHFKVSADGATWFEALTIDRATGVVSLPQGLSSLPVFGASEKGVVPASGGGSTAFLRADGAWSAPASSAGGNVPIPYKTSVGRWHVNSDNTTTLTTLGGVANRIDLAPWLCPIDLTIDQVGAICSTAIGAALGKIVCYNSDALGHPNDLIFESGTVDFSSIGFKSTAQVMNFVRGELYWIGLRSSSTATVNAHQPYCSPILGYPAIPTTVAAKLLRRTLAFATSAPAIWGYNATEETSSNVPALFMRVAP